MKRFVATVAFCVCLLIFGLFFLLPHSRAQRNVLETMLNLPAPPPPNPLNIVFGANRAANFYDRSKPPADNAPVEDLLDYWRGLNEVNRAQNYAPTPSDAATRRMLAEIEKNPETLPGLINSLPDTPEVADFVKGIYDRNAANPEVGEYWSESIKNWLTYHSKYFSDELVKTAQTVGDSNDYVTNQEDLLALARVDWDKARPILDRLLSDVSQPVSQTLARWAFYEHALHVKDSSDVDKYRRELQKTVEDKNLKAGNRDLAMDALVIGGDFDGRDDWYLSLLSDETLYDLRANGGGTYTGLTTLINRAPPEKYMAKMLELANNPNPTIRNAAIRNLTTMIDDKNPEVLRVLLPWLADPNWAKETNGERRRIVNALTTVVLPESVPGLIAVLNEKPPPELSVPPSVMSNSGSSMNANRIMSNTMVIDEMPMMRSETFFMRYEAVNALANQKDARAALPLRQILPQIDDWQRGTVVKAILASGGFSIPEQLDALESIAQGYAPDYPMSANNAVMTANVNAAVQPMIKVTTNSNVSYNGNRPFGEAELKQTLAIQLVSQIDADDQLVNAVADRIKAVEPKDASLAFALRRIMQNWRGAAVNTLMLRDLKDNKLDANAVVKLLALRKELREKQSNDIYDARGGTPFALGISACLLENVNDYDTLLATDNIEAKTAMLACARLIRAPLPVAKVAENLPSQNPKLALAAERYLESEDSAEARNYVLARHPNEAKILGARTAFIPNESAAEGVENLPALFMTVNENAPYLGYYDYFEEIKATEKQLQTEVKENQELLGVYSYDNNFVRIYKDKAVFSWQEDKARYFERVLNENEFNNLKGLIAAERGAEIPPFISYCEDCEAKELLMLGRNGGRRVFVLGYELPKFFKELEAIFNDMRQPPAKLHYRLEKNVAGLEILFEDKNLQAQAVWKNGDDFRVLLEDQKRREQIDAELDKQDEADEQGEDTNYEKVAELRKRRRTMREFENFAWYKFSGGKPAGLTEQPASFEFVPRRDSAPISADATQWKARTATFELRGDETGLYKITRGQAAKIRAGYYLNPLVTPDGRWAIVSKYDTESYSRQLVRVNLATNKETQIKFEDFPMIDAVAFIPTLNKVLLFGSSYGEYDGEESSDTDISQRDGTFYLLDAATGVMQKAKGELRPLGQQTFRPLQSTGTADEFWAAIPDKEKDETQFGIYNARTLIFKPLQKIPQIEFNSMQMWVDAGKIYFVYQGHLLSLPAPK